MLVLADLVVVVVELTMIVVMGSDQARIKDNGGQGRAGAEN